MELIRYLHKLDLPAQTVSNWRDIEPHTVYLENLRKKHGRKSQLRRTGRVYDFHIPLSTGWRL